MHLYSFPKLGLDKGWQWNQIENDVDQEKCDGEDKGDAEVEPAIHKWGQVVTLVAIFLLKVVGAI